MFQNSDKMNDLILDEYIKQIKNDENLTYEEQKLLLQDANSMKITQKQINQEIARTTNSIDFGILKGLTNRLSGYEDKSPCRN